MSFGKFLKECDRIVGNEIGLGLDDMEDANWREYYEGGLSPQDAVDCADIDYWGGILPKGGF